MDALAKHVRNYVQQQTEAVFGPKGTEPCTRVRVQELGPHLLGRTVRRDDGSSFLFTDAGYEAIRLLGRSLWHAGICPESLQHDVGQAALEYLLPRLKLGEGPPDVADLVESVEAALRSRVRPRSIAAPFHGIDLQLPSAPLGSFKLVPPDLDSLRLAGAPFDSNTSSEELGSSPYLIGCHVGTLGYAKRRFQESSQIMPGIFAVFAATHDKQGVSRYRFSVVPGPRAPDTNARYYHWHEGAKRIGCSREWDGTRPLPLDSRVLAMLDANRYIQHAFAIATMGLRTPLQDAIARALSWYADAHRDAVPVMKLLKCWSCAEALFRPQGKKKKVPLSEAMAGLLVAYGAVARSEVQDVTDRISRLYDVRNAAVHEASQEVSAADADTLALWVSHTVIGVLALALDHGFADPRAAREEMRSFHHSLHPPPAP